MNNRIIPFVTGDLVTLPEGLELFEQTRFSQGDRIFFRYRVDVNKPTYAIYKGNFIEDELRGFSYYEFYTHEFGNVFVDENMLKYIKTG